MKFKAVMGDRGTSAFAKYRALVYGDRRLGRVALGELLTCCFGGWRGGLGLLLRSRLYPCLFGETRGRVFFGRDVTIRHGHKIRLGANVTIDDHAVIDAKGADNAGITIGDNVYIGRNTIVYCKNGDIVIGDNVNISSNCEVFSSNRLTLGPDTVIGAYAYLLSGGEYDYRDTAHTFAAQSGMQTKGELTVGPNCWIGARVTVLDAACIGAHCVIGAGAVVTRPVPDGSIAAGVPARVIGRTP
ncbi:MAG: hypothetical protein JW951_00575 [Lentisphaerae bacterium]|nr:hypothetical protein [Lentisphaerota bacterium]